MKEYRICWRGLSVVLLMAFLSGCHAPTGVTGSERNPINTMAIQMTLREMREQANESRSPELALLVGLIELDCLSGNLDSLSFHCQRYRWLTGLVTKPAPTTVPSTTGRNEGLDLLPSQLEEKAVTGADVQTLILIARIRQAIKDGKYNIAQDLAGHPQLKLDSSGP